ncbi:hypothetical protein RHECNPAF_122100119 [Rhizobium etli CNPAF512]|nr:hypothetical protein RHECNPAF_122100119 [Rhizobium etli CNPAF512]
MLRFFWRAYLWFCMNDTFPRSFGYSRCVNMMSVCPMVGTRGPVQILAPRPDNVCPVSASFSAGKRIKPTAFGAYCPMR